jgi:hypothetical protein
MADFPKLREDLVLEEFDDHVLLSDPRSGQHYVLNGTAAAIAEMCDGNTTLRHIGQVILSVLPADPAQVQRDVKKTVLELGRLGFLASAFLHDELASGLSDGDSPSNTKRSWYQ